MRVIDPKMEIDNITTSIKQYFIANGSEDTKAIIGISGGKDSTIAAALLVRALGPDKVIGVLMPQDQQKDIDDSYRICEALGIQHFTVNIGPTCDSLYTAFMANTALPTNSQILTNAPARIRMNVLYMVAAAVGGRVINTGNASELYVGYTTKYGDLAGDYAIFKEYYVRDVLMIGAAMTEIPMDLVEKAPGDGMSGKTDEDNLGFSYETLDTYIIDEVAPDYSTLRKIRTRYKNNTHKRCIDLPHPRVMSRHDENDADWREHLGCGWF